LLDYSKDPMIRMIEEGAGPFDQKEGFKKSSKKHIKKDGGWYLTIPFSVGNPSSQVTSGFSSIMPKEIYNVVKKQNISSTTNRSAGLLNTDLPAQFQVPNKRAAIIIPESQSFKEYQHKSSIYKGLFKQKDAITGQSNYGSFRRVSDKSDEDSWIHKGFSAAGLAEKAFNSFESKIPTILEDSMNKYLADFQLS